MLRGRVKLEARQDPAGAFATRPSPLGSHLLARVARCGKARGTTGRRRSTSAMVALSKGSRARSLYGTREPEAPGPSSRSNSSCSRR